MPASRILGVLRRRIPALFGRDDRVTAIYLFGSAARTPERQPRDLDLAFLMAPSFDPERDFDFPLRARTRLEEETGTAVDVVVLNTADPVLQYQIRRDGKLLLERDRQARIGWEVHSRKLWFDRQPAHRLYMQKLEDRLLQTGETHGR